MKQSQRIWIALGVLLLIVVAVLGIDWQQRLATSQPVNTATPLPAGSIPIYFNARLVGGFAAADMEKLPPASFTDAAEGKPQEGWLLRDVLLLYIPVEQLKPETMIIVSSSSRNKSATLNWAEVQEPANMVIFDLSNRGTLKLVSAALPKLDEREEWVQDADRIEVSQP